MGAAGAEHPPRVRAVSVEAVRPLRHRVLRPHQPFGATLYPGDAEPLALHAGAFLAAGDAEPASVLTIAPDPHPEDPRPGDWRMRGMATEPAERGRGLGAAVLAACLEHAAAHGAARVWCFARVPARTLYERAGFAAEGAVFELDDIGPHLLMSRPLPAPAPPPGGRSTPPS